MRAAARYGLALAAMLYAYRGLDQALPQPGAHTATGAAAGASESEAAAAAKEAHRAIVRVLGPRVR